MINKPFKHPIVFRVFAVIAIVFGMLTLKSGGMVLFTDGAAHQAAGNYVPWFNFMAGFAYIVAGVGLWQQQLWAGKLAALIAVATVAVFVAFGIHILNEGAYEVRTAVAMSVRSGLWVTIALLAFILGVGTRRMAERV